MDRGDTDRRVRAVGYLQVASISGRSAHLWALHSPCSAACYDLCSPLVTHKLGFG
jgi:hypothetical protein